MLMTESTPGRSGCGAFGHFHSCIYSRAPGPKDDMSFASWWFLQHDSLRKLGLYASLAGGAWCRNSRNRGKICDGTARQNGVSSSSRTYNIACIQL